MRAVGRVVAVAGVCAALSGCQTKEIRVDFSDAPRDYVGKDYARVYERWTRHQEVFLDADVALEVWATFKSWDFREAYIERYAEIYSLSEGDEKTLRESQRKILGEAYEFHVTAQSSNYKWNDLEKASSPWRAALVDALGHELAPEYVKIEKLPDAFESEFFPKRTPFTKTYAIRFAIPADGSAFLGTKSGAITLRISSPIGRVELEWRS
ncbi:MAG TPA: hypothetical protein VHL80_01315 [Polyangia bacterium]|nr:hypothetical protein [Polyangia bacterium]